MFAWLDVVSHVTGKEEAVNRTAVDLRSEVTVEFLELFPKKEIKIDLRVRVVHESGN
jgi:hypothetical protein